MHATTPLLVTACVLVAACAKPGGYIDNVAIAPQTRPLPAEYEIGEPVHATRCDTSADALSVHELMQEAQGDSDALVEVVVTTRRSETTISGATYVKICVDVEGRAVRIPKRVRVASPGRVRGAGGPTDEPGGEDARSPDDIAGWRSHQWGTQPLMTMESLGGLVYSWHAPPDGSDTEYLGVPVKNVRLGYQDEGLQRITFEAEDAEAMRQALIRALGNPIDVARPNTAPRSLGEAFWAGQAVEVRHDALTSEVQITHRGGPN